MNFELEMTPTDTILPNGSNDEIDLVQLFQTIWDGKLFVIAITAAATVFGGIFAFTRPAEFVSVTNIRPITQENYSEYALLDVSETYSIEKQQLLNMFIETVRQEDFLTGAVMRAKLLDRAQFGSEAEYESAIQNLASDIQLLEPVLKGKQQNPNWRIQFEGSDKLGWLSFLTEARRNATNEVRQALIAQFEGIIAAENRRVSYLIEDLKLQIANARSDYRTKMRNRLAFLSEQGAIARELGVAKNTLEAQTFTTTNNVIANVSAEAPFYLRGYEAIEKEIELIKSRSEIDAFVPGLFALQTELRALEQDQSISRAQQLFANTPIVDAEKFVAVEMNITGSDIQNKSKRALIVALSIVLGGMVGIFFVLIRSAIQSRRAT